MARKANLTLRARKRRAADHEQVDVTAFCSRSPGVRTEKNNLLRPFRLNDPGCQVRDLLVIHVGAGEVLDRAPSKQRRWPNDLARNPILLPGLKPDEDIKIKFTGMRPGEKLYEELSTLLEDTAPTAHEKIRIYAGKGMPDGDVEMWLLCLREGCENRDAGRLVVALKEMVLDYSPSTHVLKRVIPARAVRA